MSTPVTDDRLVQLAAELAVAKSDGFPISPAVADLVAAIAAEREETRRHELAAAAKTRAEEIGSTLTQLGLQFLRVALFGLSA